MDVDYGRLDFEVNQIDAVLDLDGRAPGRLGAGAGAGGAKSGSGGSGSGAAVSTSASAGTAAAGQAGSGDASGGSSGINALAPLRWAKSLVGRGKQPEEPAVSAKAGGSAAVAGGPARGGPLVEMEQWWTQLVTNVQQGKWAAGGKS